MKDGLRISEHFLSLQGEGPNTGIPSVFLRLTGCKLDCAWCDTTTVWKKGEWYDSTQLVTLFEENGYSKAIDNGAHLILTGGDPLLQQEFLSSWLENSIQPYFGAIHITVETEGVIGPTVELQHFVTRFMVSPKLSNSGMAPARRINPQVLRWHARDHSSFFKIVVGSEEDLTEAIKLIADFGFMKSRVSFMPCASSREQLLSEFAVRTLPDYCMKNGYRFCTRLHVWMWDRVTGV